MNARAYDACVIAASAGGVSALIDLLGGLHPRLPLTVMIVLHVSASENRLPQVLGVRCPLPIEDAQAGVQAAPGRVWLAPAGYHLLIEKTGHFALSVDERICHVRPSADVLFTSAADAWRERLIGVVLTGGNEDGAQGLREIRSRGGLALIQDPGEAEAPQMPRAALVQAGADHVLPLREIAPRINRLAGL